MKENFVGVIVDAGHGGIDSGAVGSGLEEKNLTLEAAKYMYNRLTELGIPAKLTREGDEYLPKADRIKKVLELYNNSPNTILISNHINAGGAEGAEIVYSLKNNSTLADLVLDNIASAGQIKRKTYQRRLPENPNKDYYYILRESGNTEPILVEYGFIDNSRDANKLKNYITDYAEGVVKAIADYIGYPYTLPGNQTEYIVKRGDTLYSISKRFNVSVDSIKRWNQLTSNNLYIGQTLKLQEEVEEPDIYTVKKGDTLYSIASKYQMTVDEIKRINNLTSNNLTIGQQLLLKKQEETIPDEEIEEYDYYTVQKGDSLWKIARTYNMNVTELIELNNLDNLTLQIGQQLKVPKQDIEENIYIVEEGDTLWSIAKKYNLDVNKLKEINNLSSNLLSIGQELMIKQ